MTFRRPDSPLKLKPSEYFKRQCFVSAEADEDFVKQVHEASDFGREQAQDPLGQLRALLRGEELTGA